MNKNRLWIILLGAFVFYFLFANLLPVTDSVESNYTLTAKEMVQSSDWISPRIYGKVWYDKPIMIYWLLAAVFKIFGFTDWAARIVPAFFGASSVAFTYWFVKKIKNERPALLAAGILGTCFQYFMISRLIITDMILFDLNAAALAFFYLGYIAKGQTKRWYLAMYACLGLAVITKGPVGLILPGMVILSFLTWQKGWAELREMKIGPGLFIFAITGLPWYILMILKHGSLFVDSFFGVHNYLRATVSEHPRDNVFYYYLPVFVLSSLPWTGVMIGGIWDGLKKEKKGEARSLSGFLIIWGAVFLIFYSLMATKYLTYTFPIIFPFAILGAFFIEDRLTCENYPIRRWALLPPISGLILLFGAAGLIILSGLSLVIYLGCLGIFSVGIFWCFARKKVNFPRGFLVIALVYLLFTAMVLSTFAIAKSGKNFAKELSAYRDYQIGTYKFYSTSAVYYSGNLIIKVESEQNIHLYRNPSLSWYAKYTMPVYTSAEFRALSGKKKMIIVPKSIQKEFLKEARMLSIEKMDEKGDRLYFRIK
jgi:4-amino-4-deoxy-L-arabinose transferase-like glycosyltransferase